MARLFVPTLATVVLLFTAAYCQSDKTRPADSKIEPKPHASNTVSVGTKISAAKTAARIAHEDQRWALLCQAGQLLRVVTCDPEQIGTTGDRV